MTEAPSFADFVQQTREKKKKEALAQEILGSRGRKPNGAGAIAKSTTQKPSLMSRMSSGSGVTKSRSSSAKPTGNIEGKWQHDLHKVNNPNGPPSKNLNRTASASQVDRNTRTFNKFQSIVRNNAPAPEPSGFSIKGIAAAGPYTVIASNFAPGTTAADIEAAMTPHATEGGGELLSCRLITSTPTVMVEMQVDRMESADNIISIFNNKKVCMRRSEIGLVLNRCIGRWQTPVCVS
jgi:hypothetical protein